MNHFTYQTESKSFFVLAGWMEFSFSRRLYRSVRNGKDGCNNDGQCYQRHFLRLGLDKAKLRGQRYGGCSTMMGKKKGVATLIKRDVQALALSTHRYAHSLNLTGEDWIKSSTVVSNSFIRRMKSRSWSNFLQSAIHTFANFTRRSITKTKKSLVLRCKP